MTDEEKVNSASFSERGLSPGVTSKSRDLTMAGDDQTSARGVKCQGPISANSLGGFFLKKKPPESESGIPCK
jgi:hypothetical protein